jgi:hypothetical protein
MIKLTTSFCAAAVMCFAPVPSFAVPLANGYVLKADRIVQDVGVVCDEYGGCWGDGARLWLRIPTSEQMGT